MDAATELTWTHLQRPPQPDPPRQPTDSRLLTLPLPASGRHYRRCRAASPAEHHPYFKRSSRLPPAHITASQATPCHPHCASARLPSAPPAAMPMNMPVNSNALRRLRDCSCKKRYSSGSTHKRQLVRVRRRKACCPANRHEAAPGPVRRAAYPCRDGTKPGCEYPAHRC